METTTKRTHRCPICAAPVSVEGSARNGLLLHDCETHGLVQPKFGTEKEILARRAPGPWDHE